MKKAILLAEQAGWMAGLAGAWSAFGVTNRERGHLEEAFTGFKNALAIERLAGNQLRQATVLTGLGGLAPAMGLLHESADQLSESAEMFDAMAPASARANAHQSLGSTLNLLGRWEEAARHLDTALEVFTSNGDQASRVITLATMAEGLRDTGRVTEARAKMQEAWTVFADLKYDRVEAAMYMVLGTIEIAAGEREIAAVLLRRALRLAEEAASAFMEAEIHIRLANALTHHPPEEAIHHANRGLELAKASGFRVLAGEATGCLATIHEVRGDHELARRLASESLEILRPTGFSR